MRNYPCFLMIAFGIIVIAAGCTVNRHYSAPMVGNQLKYFSKPTLEDQKDSTATYVGGDYSLIQGNNPQETINSYTGSIHRSHVFQHAGLSYGVFGFGGNYDVKALSTESGKKGFYGWGVKGGGNLNIPFGGVVDWHVIGVEGAYSQEYGDYRSFRQELSPNDSVKTYQQSGEIGSIALTSELVFHMSSHSNTAVKASLGRSINGEWGNFKATAAYNNEHFSIYGNMLIITNPRSDFYALGIRSSFQIGLQIPVTR